MSIFNYCPKCFGSFALDLTECPKCQTRVPAQGKKFRIDFMNGRQRITKVVSTNLTRARQTEAELRNNADHGEISVKKNKITLDAAFENYRKNNKIKNMDHNAWDYQKHIAPKFGLFHLQKITPELIEGFKFELLNTLAPKTVKNIIMIISAAFNFARKMGYQGSNPIEKVSKPKIKNEVMNLLTDADRKRLVEVLDAHPRRTQAMAIKLLIFTGLRVSEALQLEWRDVDFDKRCLYIRDAKSGYNESIPLNEAALEIFKERRENIITQNALVFPGRSGKITNRINFVWNKIKKAAGLSDKIRLHDLRHDFATRLANTGEVSLQIIGRLLRHRSSAMTQRYAHLVDETLRKAAEKIK